jgi:hypothetical protein
MLALHLHMWGKVGGGHGENFLDKVATLLVKRIENKAWHLKITFQ